MSSNRQQEQHRVDCLEILRDEPNEKAILIKVDPVEYDKIPGEACEIWIPRSQLHGVAKNPHDCHIMITPWIAKRKELL